MMDENPYQAPAAPLEGPQSPAGEGSGPLLPWEVPTEGGALTRALATARMVLAAPEEAGTRVARSRAVGQAGAYFALAGLPFHWVAQAMVAAGTSLDAQANAWIFKLMHVPVPPPPTPEQMAFQKVILWVGVVLTPLTLALGIVISGLLAHAGLWMVKGLQEKRGLETTFRSMLYVAGSTSWLGFLNALGVFLPAGAQPIHQLLSVGLALGIFSYQGLLLGHAHGIKPSRGILAIFMPVLIILCCAASCLIPVIIAGASRG
jgi:hypothetical protein